MKCNAMQYILMCLFNYNYKNMFSIILSTLYELFH